MSLGEAFVEIHADLRPFGRDLRQGVPPIVKQFERAMKDAIGQAVATHAEGDGVKIGDRLSRGMKRSIINEFRTKNAFIAIAGALGSALDDGISALPTEVKAAIVLGIIAALPIIGGALTGAIVAAIGAGVAIVGVLLASQFESVQKRAVDFGRNVRRDLTEAARGFEPAVLQAFDMIETRIRRLRPLLENLFDNTAGFLEPLVEGGLDAIEQIVQSTVDSLENIQPFVDELGVGFGILGDAIADAIEILASTGEDGVKALRDLIAFVGAAIVSFALLLKFLTRVYGIIRQIVIAAGELAGDFAPVFRILEQIFKKIDERANRNQAFINSNTDMGNSFQGLIAATKGETDALDDYRDAIERASESVKDQLELSISWEESLDEISEALERNGKTLDIGTDKGRENAKAFLEALKIAEDAAVQRVRRGEQTAEQAAASYEMEIAKLRELARAAGVSEADFNRLYDSIILTAQLRISSTEIGVDDLAGALGEAGNQAEQLYAMLQLIMNLRRSIGSGALAGVRGFADGGIHTFPEIVRVAEDGPEVTIPLTKPARAAALMQQSGLDKMLTGGGASQVLVFIGNEQLDSRMVRIVERGNQAQALALSHGGRQL